jgi:hypothetical protein
LYPRIDYLGSREGGGYLGRESEESEGASGREAPTAQVGRKSGSLPPSGDYESIVVSARGAPCRTNGL